MANTPVHLSYDSAVTLLRRAVMEKGADYVYEVPENESCECAYFTPSGDPSCIVGYVLHYKGITLQDVGNLNEGLSIDNLEETVIDCDARTMGMLKHVQFLQDQGQPWGECIDNTLNRSPVPA